jgi:hypothetical protein
MTEPRPDEMGRVVPFERHKGRARAPRAAPPEGGPVEDLTKYAQSREPDEYRQRMINNGLALALLLLLVAIGVWLATSMAELRRNQDCVLSGRRDCAPVVVPTRPPG